MAEVRSSLRLHLGHGQTRPQRRRLQGRAAWWTHSVTLRSGSPNPQWKRKNENHFCVLFLKASGYFLTPSSFFPERELTSPHGFLAGEGGARARGPQPGCPPPTPPPRASALPAPGTGAAAPASCSWFFEKERKKSCQTTKEERKKSNIRTCPCPSKTEMTFLLPQRNYPETLQATLGAMVSHCSASPPRSTPFSLSLRAKEIH